MPASNSVTIPSELEPIANAALQRVQTSGVGLFNLYFQKEMLPAGSTLVVNRVERILNRDTYFVFSDELPQANWGHPCRYLLFDAKTQELYEEITAEFPPESLQSSPDVVPFHQPFTFVEPTRLWALRPSPLALYRPSSRSRYALLFAGKANPRHVNDLEFLYRTLTDVYDVAADHIYVLNYDGQVSAADSGGSLVRWPGDNSNYRLRVNGQGTQSALDRVFADLGSRLQPEDSLLIHTNGHGGHDGRGSFLYPHSGPDILTNYFQDKLAALPRFRCLIVMMEQCYAGGFVNRVIIGNQAQFTSIATACDESHPSYGGTNFNSFAYHWIAAMNGATPEGKGLASNPDENGDGRLSAREAYKYSFLMRNNLDSPIFQYSNASADRCHLGVSWNLDPKFAGLAGVIDHAARELGKKTTSEARETVKRLHSYVRSLAASSGAASPEIASQVQSKLNALLR